MLKKFPNLIICIFILCVFSFYGCNIAEEQPNTPNIDDDIDNEFGVSEIQINPKYPTMVRGDKTTFEIQSFDDNGTLITIISRYDYTWISSNPEVAQITDTGTLEAISKGESYITASIGNIKSNTVCHFSLAFTHLKG